jgi:hypothetical protein
MRTVRLRSISVTSRSPTANGACGVRGGGGAGFEVAGAELIVLVAAVAVVVAERVVAAEAVGSDAAGPLPPHPARPIVTATPARRKAPRVRNGLSLRAAAALRIALRLSAHVDGEEIAIVGS